MRFLSEEKERICLFIFQMSRSDSVAEGAGNLVPCWGLVQSPNVPLLMPLSHLQNRRA